jgi:hypothetical protein
MKRTIYEKADEVAIWLGTKYENSNLAFVFLSGVLERADAEAWAQKLLIDPNSEVYLCALTLLLLRQY